MSELHLVPARFRAQRPDDAQKRSRQFNSHASRAESQASNLRYTNEFMSGARVIESQAYVAMEPSFDIICQSNEQKRNRSW